MEELGNIPCASEPFRIPQRLRELETKTELALERISEVKELTTGVVIPHLEKTNGSVGEHSERLYDLESWKDQVVSALLILKVTVAIFGATVLAILVDILRNGW